MRTSHAAIALLLAACGAQAQVCTDIVLNAMPDFDMRRSIDCPLGTGWLPGNGNAYAAPTATMNLIAYLAGHGLPSLTTPPAPQDWQLASLYNDVTLMIGELGTNMHTDPVEGTTPFHYASGIRAYLMNHGPGGDDVYISMIAMSAEDEGVDLISHTADLMRSGGLVNAGIMWMSYDDDHNQYNFVGRHVVSIAGITGPCEERPHAIVHDPATQGGECTQDPFDPEDTSCFWFEANFHFPEDVPVFAGRYRFSSLSGFGPASAIVDGVRGFFPPALIAPCTVNGRCLRLQHPWWWLDDPEDPFREFELNIFAPIQNLVLEPRMTSVLFTTPRINLPAGLHRLQFSSGEMQTLATFPTTPTAMAADRFGDVFMRFGNQIRRYEIVGGAAVMRAALDTDFAPDAMVYDDETDELVGVLAQRRLLVRWPRDLRDQMTMDLPDETEIPGQGLIALNPQDNRVWVMGTSARWACEIVPAAGGGPGRANCVELPGLSSPTAFVIDPTGRIIVSQGGISVVYIKRPGMARWQVDHESPFNEQPIGSTIAIPRSRDTYTGRRRETMELDSGTPFPTPCAADFNLDTLVNSQDLFDFLSAFFAGRSSADFNHDGTRNSQDFFDYLRVFLGGC